MSIHLALLPTSSIIHDKTWCTKICMLCSNKFNHNFNLYLQSASQRWYNRSGGIRSTERAHCKLHVSALLSSANRPLMTVYSCCFATLQWFGDRTQCDTRAADGRVRWGISRIYSNLHTLTHNTHTTHTQHTHTTHTHTQQTHTHTHIYIYIFTY